MSRVRAPELPQDLPWLNCDRPLSLKTLRGRMVILDFWTYCCINCLHMLPHLNYLERQYADDLTVIGIHSAKFDHEQGLDSIRQALVRYEVHHPVLVDRAFEVWQQYAIRAYPTLAVIDPQGYVIAQWAGERDRATLEDWIGQFVRQYQAQGTMTPATLKFNPQQPDPISLTPLAFPGKVLADQATDSLFIADSGHHRIVVTTLTGELKQVMGTGDRGFQDGSFTTAQFSAPQGMAFDRRTQLLYVADTDNHALRQVDLSQQTVTTRAGTGAQRRDLKPYSGIAQNAELNSPWDVVQVGDRLYLAMAGAHQIWEMDLSSGLICTYAGTGAEFCVDGAAEQAAFAQPSGITTDGKELFVADSETSSIRAIGLGSAPVVRTVCGSGDLYGFGDRDGTGAQVRLQHCLGISYADGVLWVADTYNHSVKRVNPTTGECQTVVGKSVAGREDGQKTVASFYEPSGLSGAGSYLYVADTNNHVIRWVNLKTQTVSSLMIENLCAPTICLPPFDV